MRHKPMLATLVHEAFSDPEWFFERKLDGERCIVVKDGGSVTLYSRNGNVIDHAYPELVEAFGGQRGSFVVDGEIVAFEGDVTSFSKLQSRMQVEDPQEARDSGVAVYFYAFDMLEYEGGNMTDSPLEERKSALKQAMDYHDPIRYMAHRNENGKQYLKEACDKGWEGLIAKDRHSTYVHSRSRKWLKFKCTARQEFVIGGYTEPHGERIGFGALLVGYYEERGADTMRYAGKVGTGYDDETLKRLHGTMRSMQRKTPPFTPYEGEKLPDKETTWITPNLVCEVGFTEWTEPPGEPAKLRHPRFLGLRRDKDPKDVVREGKSP
ncbi:MAG: non-homologous end-joining DNA ligase [Oceanidesulfovibrio sp.]